MREKLSEETTDLPSALYRRDASFHRHVHTPTAEGYFYCQVLCKLRRASPITDIYGTQIETEK